MDRKNKLIIFALWFILISEWIGLLILIYLARLPNFISLFVVFVQLISPWLIVINVVFLFYTLFSGKLELTLPFWRDYLKELFRFFILSSLVVLLAIAVSATLGTAFGLSADRISRLPTIKAMQKWVNQHLYEYQAP